MITMLKKGDLYRSLYVDVEVSNILIVNENKEHESYGERVEVIKIERPNPEANPPDELNIIKIEKLCNDEGGIVGWEYVSHLESFSIDDLKVLMEE